MRVLELRSTAGQGGGPERAVLLAATAARRYHPRAARNGEVTETLCFLRRVGEDELWVDRRALELGLESQVIEERWALEPRTLGRLRRLVREHSIQIVHAHDYKADLYAYLLARLEGVIPVATAHGWPVRTLRERLVYYPGDRALLRSFPVVFAVANDLRQQLVGRREGDLASRIETLPNAVDVEAFKADAGSRERVRREWGLSEGERVVGSLGRLDPEKRPGLLVEAFAGVAAKRPELRLVVAGDGSRGRELENEAQRRGVRDRCLALGHRADAEVVHRGFDVFVQASDSEGSPYSLLEAMATGTPVIATAVGGVPELIRNGVDGLLIAPGDAPALASAIEETLRSPEAAARRAASARSRVCAERSLRAREERMVEHYRRLLEAREPGAAEGARLASPRSVI
jgi:glycosyltransferase involved in cell wall biosynthesis